MNGRAKTKEWQWSHKMRKEDRGDSIQWPAAYHSGLFRTCHLTSKRRKRPSWKFLPVPLRSPRPAWVVWVARVGGLCIHGDVVLPQRVAEGFLDVDRLESRSLWAVLSEGGTYSAEQQRGQLAINPGCVQEGFKPAKFNLKRQRVFSFGTKSNEPILKSSR